VDVPPRVTLSTYKGLAVKAEEVKPDLTRVDETLENYRENLATLVPVEDRAAQSGDVAVIDFVGKAKNEAGELEEFEGGSAEDFQVEIKEGRFIPGFVEGIVGMKLAEQKDIEVTFPADYPQAELADSPATFSITLKELKEKELPELDDDFAEEVSEFDTLEALRKSLEDRYTQEATDGTDANIEQALLNELVTHLEAEIPDTLVKREVDFLVTQTAMQLSRQGIDLSKFMTKELIDNMRSNARPEAIERLRRTLALGEIAKQESIKVEEAEIKARADEMMAEVEDPSQIDPERLMQVVNEDLMKEKILAWLKSNSAVEMVPEGSLAPAEADEASEEAAIEVAAVEASDVEEADVEASDVEEADSADAASGEAATTEKKAAGAKTAKPKSTKAKPAKAADDDAPAEKSDAKPKAAKPKTTKSKPAKDKD
jgi:trigger factor